MMKHHRRTYFPSAVTFLACVLTTAAFLQCTGDDPVFTPGGSDGGGAGDGPFQQDPTEAGSSDGAADDGAPPTPVGFIQWGTSFGTGTGGSVVAVDADGNAIVAMRFRGTLMVGGRSFTAAGNGLSAADTAIVKIAANSTESNVNVLWASVITGTEDENVGDITVDANGDAYVAGVFDGPEVDVAGSKAARGAAFGRQGFFAKINGQTGAGIWAKAVRRDQTDGGGSESAGCASIRARGGKVAVACVFRGRIGYDGIPGVDTLSDRTGVLVALIDPNAGNVQWSDVLSSDLVGAPGTNPAAEAVDVRGNIDLDQQGNAYICGLSNAGAMRTRSIAHINGSEKTGPTAAFVAKFASSVSNGSAAWVRIFGAAPGGAECNALAIDTSSSPSAGAVYVSGAFKSANFGSGVVNSKDPTKDDAYVARLDTAGAPVWAKPYGGVETESALSLGVDRWGQPIVLGGFQNAANMTIDGKPLPNGNGFYIMKLDPARGTSLYLTARTSTTMSPGKLAITPAGNAIATGSFNGALDLTKTLTSTTGTDTFVMSVSP